MERVVLLIQVRWLVALILVVAGGAGPAGCIDGSRVTTPSLPSLFADSDIVPPDDSADGAVEVDGEPGDLPEVSPDTDDAQDVAEVDGDAPDVPGPDADACSPGEPGCPNTCTVSADCLGLDDGNLCNGRWACEDGTCVEDTEPVVCPTNTSVQCYENRCDPLSGQCALMPKVDGAGCTDLDSCTAQDHCIGGICVAGNPIFCDDDNPCTDDGCIGGKCTHSNSSGPCDDGNPCSTDDICVEGRCEGATSVCECSVDADCASLDDGNACNGSVVCSGGTCVVDPGTIVVCPASTDPCSLAACDPATGDCISVTKADGVGCTDDNPCTVGDTCQGGTCSGTPLACPSTDCMTGSCDPATGCVRTPVDDGTACTGAKGCADAGTCVAGVCAADSSECGCVEDADCASFDDDNLCNGSLACVEGRCVLDPTSVVICKATVSSPCKVGTCEPSTGVCTIGNKSNGTACTDRNVCTTQDKCQNGLCTGTLSSCTGGSPCTQASCDPFSGCKVTNTGGVCAGSDVCVAAAGCAAGVCEDVLAVVCADTGVCRDEACDPTKGGCVATPLTGPCSDENPCTAADTCIGGECVGSLKSCEDGNPCTDGTCDESGACVQAPSSGAVCTDGNSCTIGDTCDAGACVGVPLDACECDGDDDCAQFEDGNLCNGTLFCDSGTCAVDSDSVVTCDDAPGGPCLESRCDPGTGQCSQVALADGLACVSNDACQSDGACNAGSCVGQPVGCDDGNPCTTDSCDSVLGCLNELTTGPCDDGTACTASSSCEAGECVGSENTCDCQQDSDCAASEDGDLCNGTLVCVDGGCVVDTATIVVCAPSESACGTTACDPDSGACVETANEGADCEDGNPCTTNDSCVGLVCTGGDTVACESPSECASASCDPATGACTLSPVEGACSDGNPCTSGDTCQGGACVGENNNCGCSTDEDCDAQLTNKCLGQAVCGIAGCELLPGTEVDCSSDSDTACEFLECDPETGGCVDVTLDEGATCQPVDKCFGVGACTSDGLCDGEAIDCDDGNACTVDSCDPEIGCVNEPVAGGSACDDSDPCTVGTTCQAGVCKGGLNQCSCSGQADCDSLPVDNPCEGTYSCQSGSCVLSEPVVCAPTGKEPCLFRECNPQTGSCAIKQADGGTPCNDQNDCTSNDRCTFDTCVGTPKVCADDNPCTLDTCDGGQCINTVQDSGPCDDGNPCFVQTECSAGECGGGIFVCACGSDSQCKVFDDNNACNGVWRCTAGGCAPAEDSEVTCVDPDPFDCVDVTCDPLDGTCKETTRANGVACNDGSVCTTTDVCFGDGQCGGTVAVACDDPSPDDCMDVVCDPVLGACVSKAREDGEGCSDEDECTTGDVCLNGGCQGTLIDCSDDNPCTQNTCSALSGCKVTPLFGPCEDGDPCTEGEACVSNVCQGGSDVCGCVVQEDCDFLDTGDLCLGEWKCVSGRCEIDETTLVTCEPSTDPCKEVVCSAGACSEVDRADFTACDDGDLCTVGDKCVAGACVSGAEACDDGNPCTEDSCDPVDGSCTSVAAANDTACEDADPCNGADSCQGGVCVGGSEQTCGCVSDGDCAAQEDGDLCNGRLVCRGGQCVVNQASVVVCPVDPSGCAPLVCDPGTGLCGPDPVPNGSACSDGDPCTVQDTCTAGVCAGVPQNCDDGLPCTIDECLGAFGCVHSLTTGACDDGNPCTTDTVCVQGACVGVPNPCDDGNPCTKDDCLASQGCRHLNEPGNTLCDDGDPCTGGDKCTLGVCTPTSNVCDPCVEAADCATGDLCEGVWDCVDNECVLDVSTTVVCPGDTPCATWACDPLDGQCKSTPVPGSDGQACDDGTACTSADACDAGECVGAAVTCIDNPSPCIDATCDPIAGCQDGHVQASCDDSQGCTVDDRCVAGSCAGEVAMSIFETYDDGDLSPWTSVSQSTNVTWRLSGLWAASPPLSLAAIDPDTGLLTGAAAGWSATAVHEAVAAPLGVNTQGGSVRMLLRMDVPGDVCFAATLGGALVFERCEATNGFIVVDIPLGQVGGQDVVLELSAAHTPGLTSTGELTGGIFVDDLVFDWGCQVDGL